MPPEQTVVSAPIPVVNRLRAIMLHVPFYSIEGAARLAAETGFSRSTITRLCSQKSRPSFRVAEAIAKALSKRSGRRIHTEEIFTHSGTYPTPSACQLMGCSGCLPPQAWNERTDTLKDDWKQQKPGDWSRQQASPITPATHS